MINKDKGNKIASKSKMAAIILAAGYSSRMGDFKPLLKFGEKTALELIVDSFNSAGITDIIVVTGHNSDKLMEHHADIGVIYAYNENYDKDMYSSVVTGVNEINDDIDGFFILPVDIPLVKYRSIIEIKEAFIESGKGIIHPVFNGKRGHPPLISTYYKEKIINNNEDGGLHRLLQRHENDSWEIELIDESILKDMDTPIQYERLLEYYKHKDIPNPEECKAIMNKYFISDNVTRHCQAVRDAAMKITDELIKRGYKLNRPLIEAASLLHDIERDKHDHALRAYQLVKELGYEDVADIIKEHMDIILEPDTINEKEIVYLSDKLVMEDKLVSIDERFERALEKFKDNKKVLGFVMKRKRDAEIIAEKIKKSGVDIYEVL